MVRSQAGKHEGMTHRAKCYADIVAPDVFLRPRGKLVRVSSELQTGVLGLGQGRAPQAENTPRHGWLGGRSEPHLQHPASLPSPGRGGSLGAPED